MKPVSPKSVSNELVTIRLTVRGYNNNEGEFCDKIGKKGYDWKTLLQKPLDILYPDMKITIKKSDENSVLFNASFVNRSTRTADVYIRLNYFLGLKKFLIPASLEMIN